MSVDTVLEGMPLTKFALPETDSVEEAFDLILDRLAIMYLTLQPDRSITDFTQGLVMPIAAGGEDIQLEFKAYEGHTSMTYRLYMDLMIKATFYAVRAPALEEQGHQAKGWSYVANALYYLGALEAVIILDPALEAAFSATGKKGAKKRAEERFGPLKKFARELAEQYLEYSKAEAARRIKDEVLARSKTMEPKVNLVESNAEKLLDQWLTGLPFRGKRKPRSKNVKG